MDFEQAIRILKEAQGDTARLGLASVDLLLAGHPDEEREKLRTALEVSAVPHWFDEKILAALLDSPLATDAEALAARLRRLPVVEPFPARGPGAANVHEATRRALRARMKAESPERLRALSTRAQACFAGDAAPHAGIEALYHRLTAEPQAYEKPKSGWDYLLKEIEDWVLAALLLVVSLPMMGLIAACIKLDSRGPVFFREQRYGFNDQLIDVIKFRTLYVEQQDDANQLVTRGDPRVTRVGRFLRRTSLDEVPQLLNVLKGDMSIVGPRPHAVHAGPGERLYAEVVEKYAFIHKVKPGITGWAQINGWRGETDTEEKIRKRLAYDIDYINKRSLLFDLEIILKTTWVAIKGDKPIKT